MRERERERELLDGVSKIYTYKKNARARTFDCFDSFIVTVPGIYSLLLLYIYYLCRYIYITYPMLLCIST